VACALRVALAAFGYAGLIGVMFLSRGLALPMAMTVTASAVVLGAIALGAGALVARFDKRAPIVTLALVGVLASLTEIQADTIITATVVRPSVHWMFAGVLAGPLMLSGAAMALRRRAASSDQ
jgi:hypothetical protein